MNSEELRNLIAKSRTSIRNKTSIDLTSSESFLRLLSLVQSYGRKASQMFFIVIDEANLSQLVFDKISDNLESQLFAFLRTKNIIEVDNEFNIVDSAYERLTDSTSARRLFIEMSTKGKCILLISKLTPLPHYFIRGTEVGEATFFTEADYRKYQELRDINDYEIVINEFREELKKYHVYSNFFVPRSCLVALFSKGGYHGKENILRNKPEDHLRNALKDYLTKNIKRTFNIYREPQMDSSSRRVDIISEDDFGNIYFFEIKWIGQSINDDNSRVSTRYDSERVIEGTEQTLQYIKEFLESNKNVSVGCLVVFDARQEKINYEDIQEYQNAVSEVKSKYKDYIQFYQKIDDLHIDNTNPT